MKKWLKIILVVLFILCVGWFASIYLGKTPKKSPAIAPSKPNLVQNYKGKLTISLVTKESQFKFVSKLPFLNITRKVFTEDYLNRIASFIGFVDPAMKLDDSQEGLTYFWKNDTATFFAYTKSSKVHYSSGNSVNVPNKQLSDENIKTMASKFLVDSGLLDAEKFSLGTLQFLKEGSLNEGFKKSTKEDFSLYHINILPKLTEYEIISPAATESTNYIELTKDGRVLLFQLIVFDSAQKGLVEYNLKTYEEINNSIGSSVLISLAGEETPLQYLPTDLIREITIDQISLAYLIDSSTATSLQPVYKLSGTATLSAGSDVQAILYLPALSGL